MRNASPQIRFNGAAIVLARKRAGLTQASLAGALKVTMRTVQNWEQGCEPTAANFLRLSEVLGLATDDLYVQVSDDKVAA